MPSNRVLLVATSSILVLIAVAHYGPLSEAPSATASANNLPQVKQAISAQSATTRSSELNEEGAGTQQKVPGGAATAAFGTPELSGDEKKKISLLRSVIQAGRDNDPRVDTELKNLSPALKQALKLEYESLPKEHRNGRGFIVFLIGRELRDSSDVDFLHQVITEQPCLSFKNCDAKGKMPEEAEEHSTSVTLNYPQVVASKMLKRSLSKSNPELKKKISQALTASPY